MHSRKTLENKILTVSLFAGATLLVLGLLSGGPLLNEDIPLNAVFVFSLGEVASTVLLLGVTAALVGSLVFYVKHRRELRESLKKALSPGSQKVSVRRRFTAQIAAIVIILASTVIIGTFGENLRKAFSALLGTPASELPLPGNSSTFPDLLPVTSSAPFLLQLMLSFVLVGSVLGLAGVGGYILIGAVTQARKEWKREAEGLVEQSRLAATTAIQQAISKLRRGGDLRDTILWCYEQMCEIARQNSVDVQEFHTPREIQYQIVATLALPLGPVTKLTELFEEARYSDHSISQIQSEKAITLLNDIQTGLPEP